MYHKKKTCPRYEAKYGITQTGIRAKQMVAHTVHQVKVRGNRDRIKGNLAIHTHFLRFTHLPLTFTHLPFTLYPFTLYLYPFTLILTLKRG